MSGTAGAFEITSGARLRATSPVVAYGLVLAGVAGLVIHAAAGVNTTVGTWSYDVVLAGSAIAVLVRAICMPADRLAWALIGTGMAFWALGDIYYNQVLLDRPEVPYPSLSDGLYLGMYVFLLAGLAALRGRRRGENILSSGIVVTMLGLTTVWSLLVLDQVIGDAQGTAAAVATTVAYPLLDLALLLSALLAFATRGWRFDRVLGMLVLGFLLIAIADSGYATQVSEGQTWGTLIDTMWPAGALAIAIAAFIRPSPRPPQADVARHVSAMAAGAVAVATGVLLVDHFHQLQPFTVIVAGLTLSVACAQLLLANRERTRARSQASAAEALRSASTEAALDCVVTIDGEGIVRSWNRAARRTFGYTADQAVGRELAELIIPPELRNRHRDGLARAAAGMDGPLLNGRTEVMAITSRGKELPVEVSVSRIQQDPPMFAGFLRDISDRKRRDEENERLAAIVRSSEDAILAKDLEGCITAWNDGAERLYGWKAEEAIGRSLSSMIVPPERRQELQEITARVAQGETVALETQRQDRDGSIVDVSLRLLPMRDPTGRIIGMSGTAHDVTDRRRREAQEAQDREGQEWRDRVRCALEEDRLVFWAQPVVDPRTGDVHHHELLMRMELDGEIVTPNRFLPHAERSALITDVDRWAVRAGVELARRFPVAINLSARSLGDPKLLAEINEAVTSRSLARRITFEITETAAVEQMAAAQALVRALTELGCGVALDDFGTGYGSFTYLRDLPVTELKIDIEFVRGLVDDVANQRVVRSLVAVAGNFGMRTVAEGVEDEPTLNLLRTFGVDLVQGYHLGRPEPLGAEAQQECSRGARAGSLRAITSA